jgi:hypothetical protein
MALWHRIEHPCVWFTKKDLPRLRANAQTALWRPKFDAWRAELAGLERLRLPNRPIDFHSGDNEQALKAGLCYVVDGDERYGRLIASFLQEVVAYYRDVGHTWPLRMTGWSEWGWHGSHGQWGGMTQNFITDPMMWFSCAHLYELIWDKGLLAPADAATFEEMMGGFHRLCCLHEDIIKLDNNRGAILNGGSYLSTLFDPDEIRGKFCRERAVTNVRSLMGKFLDDGVFYEIGSYAWGTVAVLEWSARLMRNVEGVDFFKTEPGVPGFEAAFRAWPGTLIPGPALRRPRLDMLNHWDSVGAGYLEYHQPEIGWALSRLHEREWVPFFRHWSQGSEFYTYSVPDNARPPEFLDSHFPAAGFAILRTSWESDARSLFFRYGFQGSSHGGGLEKLDVELTCNDEALLVSDNRVERSHFKNVVLVDYQNQEQCSGKLLRADLERAGRAQCVSALGGLGKIPDNPALHDPRIEFQYWSTKHEECFPGVARMRRTVALVDRRYFVIRDTLRTLDGQEHAYQWLFQTHAAPVNLGERAGVAPHTYVPRKIFLPDQPLPETRLTDRHAWAQRGLLSLGTPRACLDMRFCALGAELPAHVDLWRLPTLPQRAMLPDRTHTTVQIELRGKDVVMTTVLDARPADTAAYVQNVRPVLAEGLDRQVLEITHSGGRDTLVVNEADEEWIYKGRAYRGVEVV